MNIRSIFTSNDFDFAGYLNYSERGESNGSAKLLCALDVPAFLVPKEIIMFFDSYSCHIETFKVLKSYYNEEVYNDTDSAGLDSSGIKYIVLLYMKSNESANKLMHEFNGRAYSSLDSTLCNLGFVNGKLYLETDSKENELQNQHTEKVVKYFYRRMSTDLKIVESNSGEEFFQDKELRPNHASDDILCAVCLDSLHIDYLSKFIMYCGHTFHSCCVARLEPPQCPVCRFEHDISSGLLTECATCGWTGPPNDSLSLVVSQPTSSSSSSSSSSNPTSTASGTSDFVFDIPADRDVWVCLVCGYTGCGMSHAGHIQMHYEQHQHAYAMNTDTRHVFDFAGQGYVHRLVVQQSDIAASSLSSSTPATTGSSSSSGSNNSGNNHHDNNKNNLFIHNTTLNSNSDSMTATATEASSNTIPINHRNSNSNSSATIRSKLFELEDPHSRSTTHSLHRPNRVPLRHDEEERCVSVKLELIAQQHSVLLARELAVQRQQYEESIKKVRHFMQDEARHLYLDSMMHSQTGQQMSISNNHSNNHKKGEHTEKSTQKKQNDASVNNNNNSNTREAENTSTVVDSSNTNSFPHVNTNTEATSPTVVSEWLRRVNQHLAAERQKAVKQLSVDKAKINTKENEYQGMCSYIMFIDVLLG